jgi:Major tropism determinant N-terminal domain
MSTVRIQVRRGTATQWTSVNPILAAGEMGVESDTNKFKFGNGSSTWTALSYANSDAGEIGEISQDAINTALTMGAGLTKTYNDGANTITINVDSTVVALKSYVDAQVSALGNQSDIDYLLAADLGVSNGVASLNSYGKVPSSQLDITETIQDAVGGLVSTSGSFLSGTYNDAANTFVLTSTNNPVFTDVSATTSTLGTLTTTGNAGVGGNLTITGNLTVNGTSTTVNSTTMSIDDPMIYIGDGNQSSVLDLGLVAAFNDGTYQHTGLVKDASDGVWKLFAGVTAEPGTTVDFTNATYETLQVGTLSSSTANIGSVTNTEIQRLSGVTSNVQTQLTAKAPLASPTFTGTVSGVTKTMVGLENVDNTSDLAKPISTAAQSALDLKLNATAAASTYQPLILNVSDIEIGYLDGVTSAIQTQINAKASTSYSDSTYATQAALAFKAPLASPTFTGTVTLPANTISQVHLNDDSVGTNELVGLAVTEGKIADGAVTSAKIGDGAVTSAKIGDGAVTSAKIGDGAVTSAKIGDGVVTSAKIADLTIVDGDINASAAIAKTKIAGTAVVQSDLGTNVATFLATPTSANFAALIGDETGTGSLVLANSPTFVTPVLGVATATSINGTTIPSNATLIKTSDTGTVTSAMIAEGTITASDIADSAIATAKIADSAVTSAKIADGTIVDADINALAEIATSKISGLDTALANKLASATAASTYAPLNNASFTGTFSAPIGTITSSMILDGAILNADINAAAAIATSKIDGLDTALANKLASSTAASTYETISNVALKAPLASPALTGVPTAPTAAAATNTTQVATTAYVRGEVAALVNSAGATLDTLGEIATALGNDANLSATLTASIGLKAPIASPTFTGTVTVAAAGVAFTDGTQTKEGVPSRTTISQKTASYTLSALTERDSMIEMNSASAITLTVPTNATVAWPIGTSIDILRVGAGAVDIAGAGGVTINATPGLKLRAQWSSATLLKRATDTWVLVGDLSA